MKIPRILVGTILLALFACSESADRKPVRDGASLDAATPETGTLLDASPSTDSSYRPPSRDSGENGGDDDGGNEDASSQYSWCKNDQRLLNPFFYFCYKDARPCNGYQVRLRLFLDTGSDVFSFLPDGTRYDDGPHFRLFGQCVENEERMSFSYDADEVIDPSIIPGVRYQPSWKVEIDNAVIEYCETCSTEQGLVPLFGLRGSLADVRFFQDLENEYPLFIEVRDAEGNLVADFR